MSIQENLKEIKATLSREEKALAKNYGQNSLFKNPEIIAVSKKQSDETIEEALKLGLHHFGENKVQEAYSHWEKRREDYPDLKLHLLGPLQSNKVADAVSLFDVIHTVDRKKIAKSLSDEMKKQGRNLPCFIQVNTGEEDQKSGVLINELKDFLEYCIDECGLNIVGLMVIPPIDEIPSFHFALLKKYADEFGLKELSMGMSGDYDQACRYGATCLRIGSALLGERD